MIYYAMLSGASIGKLFMEGMVPGVLLAILLMIYVCVYFLIREIIRLVVMSKRISESYIAGSLGTVYSCYSSWWNLFRYLYSLGRLVFASAYALIISADYKTLGWKKLWGIIQEIICQHSYTGSLRNFHADITSLWSRFPRVVASLVMGITDNKYIFLFIVNIVFLLLGCVLDVSTIQLVFVPMVLPLVQAMGIDLVHFGVVICLNMMIGLSTPPFGMLLFIVSGLGKTKIKGVIREILPMVLIMIGLLFLVTYVPDIIMFIPNNFM